jgi:hypothetical protein
MLGGNAPFAMLLADVSGTGACGREVPKCLNSAWWRGRDDSGGCNHFDFADPGLCAEPGDGRPEFFESVVAFRDLGIPVLGTLDCCVPFVEDRVFVTSGLDVNKLREVAVQLGICVRIVNRNSDLVQPLVPFAGKLSVQVPHFL